VENRIKTLMCFDKSVHSFIRYSRGCIMNQYDSLDMDTLMFVFTLNYRI